ncbi:SLOG family protein [Kiloniella majae]|uniref:SLOG family protein n=1 Tax=Kiloniella majae TaxID=1938558 RepID=UPI000A278789|nr:SLOG family protein [Kiloniella majae]
MMKVIIAGSRTINDYNALESFVEGVDWPIEEVVSGGCRGVDTLGEQWAKKNDISKKVLHADWVKYGREAGELRNREMANYADGLILLWDGKSPGASCMLREAAKAGIKIHHQIYGFDWQEMEQAEKTILDYYWSGKGRLVFQHSHWEWEIASPDAPAIPQEAINGLIEQGFLKEDTITVLKPVREDYHSKFA